MTSRSYYWLAFVIIAILLGAADYLQFYQGITPCPLCILQRLVMGALGILFILGILFATKKMGRTIINSLSALFSVLGIVLAGRQVWLQHMPSGTVSNCDVSLQYMVQVLPFQEVLKKLFQGSAECSQVNWQFLHLSLAEWSLVWFIIFLLFSLFQLLRSR